MSDLPVLPPPPTAEIEWYTISSGDRVEHVRATLRVGNSVGWDIYIDDEPATYAATHTAYGYEGIKSWWHPGSTFLTRAEATETLIAALRRRLESKKLDVGALVVAIDALLAAAPEKS